MLRTVQIFGGARTTESAPHAVAGIERWGLNGLAHKRFSGKFEGWTRWFDLHHKPHILATRPNTYEWYKKQTKPIYFWGADPNVPASKAYPRERVQHYFNSHYFLSTLDWLIALALYEEFERIDLYWFKMHPSNLYAYQLPSANYWVGRAEGMGVTVSIHGESYIKHSSKMYGFETTDPRELTNAN